MGTTVSSLSNLKENQLLIKLVSNQHISSDPSNHRFWDELLSFAFNNWHQFWYSFILILNFNLI
jgi:hypothetical protein